MPDPVAEATDLLQHLIRNACVNDGTPESGQETRSVDVLESFLASPGLDLERHDSVPGRSNLVARVEGSDPAAPTLALMGHLDVVPANAERWRRDPFGGELVEGEVWGRGALDMLCETASMAVAVRRLAASGFRPKGTLTYLAVADEEALGTYGARWLVEHHPDLVRCDYLVTEAGGFRIPLPSLSGPKLATAVAERGTQWARITVRGRPGHASMPFGTDNALVKAAEVVGRIARYSAPARVGEVWRRFVEEADLPTELRDLLLDPDRAVAALQGSEVAGPVHAATHTTLAPTVMRAGVKTNVIPDRAEVEVDIRTLPEDTPESVGQMIAEALGDLAGSVEIESNPDPATASPLDTPLWDALQRATAALVPGARMVPQLMMGATDARFFRRLGTVAYGYCLFSDRITFAEFTRMFHGDDERIDQESLRLQIELWQAVARDLVG